MLAPLFHPPGGLYNIPHAARFRSGASPALTGSSVAGDHTRLTVSAIVYVDALTAFGHIFCAGSTTNEETALRINSNGSITWKSSYANTMTGDLDTTQRVSAAAGWYHFVGVRDTPNATANDRMRLWCNGTRLTSFSQAIYPGQNDTGTRMGEAGQPLALGQYVGFSSYFLTGSLAEINILDGVAADASAFGYFDVRGRWRPKKYAGSYGANGRFYRFDDAALMGRDLSGNGLHLTASNVLPSDQLTVTPTTPGQVLGALT